MKKYSAKLDLSEIKNPTKFFKKNIKFVLPVFLYLISTLAFIPWLKYYDVSLLYPFTALAYIWIVLISKYLLKEKVSIQRILGILLIIVGVVVTYLS